MINTVRSYEPGLGDLFDRVIRQHLEAYCLIIALITLACLAFLH